MTVYLPDRNDIVWLDFDPKKGREIGKYRPALVLTSKQYNQKTGLLICCPITTSLRGHLTEVLIDGLNKPSAVASNLVHTLSWRDRKAKFIAKAKQSVMEDVLVRLLPLIGADKILDLYQ